MAQYVEFNGEVIEFPDEMSDEQIAQVLAGEQPSRIWGGVKAAAQHVWDQNAPRAQQALIDLGDNYKSGVQMFQGVKDPPGAGLIRNTLGLDPSTPVTGVQALRQMADRAAAQDAAGADFDLGGNLTQQAFNTYEDLGRLFSAGTIRREDVRGSAAARPYAAAGTVNVPVAGELSLGQLGADLPVGAIPLAAGVGGGSALSKVGRFGLESLAGNAPSLQNPVSMNPDVGYRDQARDLGVQLGVGVAADAVLGGAVNVGGRALNTPPAQYFKSVAGKGPVGGGGIRANLDAARGGAPLGPDPAAIGAARDRAYAAQRAAEAPSAAPLVQPVGEFLPPKGFAAKGRERGGGTSRGQWSPQRRKILTEAGLRAESRRAPTAAFPELEGLRYDALRRHDAVRDLTDDDILDGLVRFNNEPFLHRSLLDEARRRNLVPEIENPVLEDAPQFNAQGQEIIQMPPATPDDPFPELQQGGPDFPVLDDLAPIDYDFGTPEWAMGLNNQFLIDYWNNPYLDHLVRDVLREEFERRGMTPPNAAGLPPPPDQPPPPDGGPSHEYADVPLEERVRQAQPYFEHDGFGKQDIDEIFGPDVWPELIRRNNGNNQNEMRASGRAAIDAAWQRVREVRDKNQDWGYPIRTAEVRKAIEAAQQVSKEARDAERGALSLVEPDANTGALSLSSESGRLSQTEYKPRTMDRIFPNDPVGPRRAQPGKALSRDPWRVEPKEDTGTGRLGDPYLSERVNDEGKRVRERAGIRPEELDIGVGPDAQVWPGAERGRTPEEVRALTDSFGEPQRSPSPENVRQGRKDSGQPISDDEFFKKVTGEYGAFPGVQGAKDLMGKVGGKIRDAFRTTDKDINPLTAGFNPQGPNRPPKRVGFPGRGFGAPSYGPRGQNKQLGGGLLARDRGQATNVVGRAMEHVTNAGRVVGQKLEQNTRKLPGRRQFERNFKTPSRIVKYLGDYRGHNARARRLLRRGRLAMRKMQRKGGLTPEMQREWVERRERGEQNPEDHLPAGPVRAYFKELGRQIDVESRNFVRNARQIAARARRRGDIGMANHFQAISDTAETRIGQYLHRAYSRKSPSEALKDEVRGLLQDNYFVRDPNNPDAVTMLRGDEMGPQQGAITFAQMSPAQRSSANQQIGDWMTRALERKEEIQTPQMGEGGIGSPKVMRNRVLEDGVYRLFRGADKAGLVGENTLALVRAQNAQLELFSKLSDHWKALARLSPDEMRKLPEATWLGDLSGSTAPRWAADLIHDNFSADAFGPADFKAFSKWMKFWKSKSTIGNLSSHRNQGLQNFVNMFMAGVNPMDPRTVKALRLAHQDLSGHGTDRGPIFARLEEAGVLEAFQEAEYKHELRRDLDQVWETPNRGAAFRAWERLRDASDNGIVKFSDAYSYWDRLAKMTTYIRATGLDGGTGLRAADHLPERIMSHEEAVSFINDFYVNFSNVPKIVSVVRNSPALQVFVTPFFAAKALSAPIYARALARKPLTLMAFMAFATGMKTLAWELGGADEERINTDLAMQTKGEKRKAKMAVPSLVGDELEALDVTGGLPNYEVLQAFGGVGDDSTAGDLMEILIGVTGDSVLSGPLPSTVYGPYARKLKEEEDLAPQYLKEIGAQLVFPGGPAQFNKLAEVWRAAEDFDKPGTAPDNFMSSDTPGERLARRGLALPGLAGQPLDARAKLNAMWENERTRKELEKRFPAVFNKLYEKRISEAEAQEQVFRLLNKQFESMKSLMPKNQGYKKPWQKPTQPDTAKSHGKVSLE